VNAKILDNIHLTLSKALEVAIRVSERTDFCVGAFNLRVWEQIGPIVEDWTDGDQSIGVTTIGNLPESSLTPAYCVYIVTGVKDYAY
jgi:hypothetical protein